MRTLITTGLLALALAATAAHAADDTTNHCHDRDSNADWAKLARENRDSDVWQRLFALRVGLCTMVERDTLSVGRATEIFERERKRGIRELKDHGERDGVGA